MAEAAGGGGPATVAAAVEVLAKPARRRRKDARPAELVEAALALFVERGFAATRIDDIAARAGVGKGTLYLYFDSKEALLEAAVQQKLAPLIGEFSGLLTRPEPSSNELLRRFVHRWWGLIGHSPLRGLPKLMVAESGNFPELAGRFVRDVVARLQDEVLAGLIRRGIARGEYADVHVPYAVRVLSHGLVFMPVWLESMGRIDRRPFDPDRHLETWLQLSGRALAGPQGEGT
mgnify:CR=1 FL=1